MTFLSHTALSSRFIQDFLDHYVDKHQSNYLHDTTGPLSTLYI